MVQLVNDIDINKIHLSLLSEEVGAIVVFVGTVRSNNAGRKVNRLEFEAYEEMALAEMEKIRVHAISTWKLSKAVISHVVGKKEIQDPIVVTGAASSHREEAFTACRYMIDQLKKTVPIWKKEYFEDGYQWVSSTP